MAHPNEDRIREGLGAFQRRDMDAVQGFLAEDIVWHIPGRSPMAGTYKGKEEVLGFMAKTAELTGGTFKLEIHDVIANDEHGVALVRPTGRRDGKTLDQPVVQVMHLRDGQVTEFWGHAFDLYTVDEFWS